MKQRQICILLAVSLLLAFGCCAALAEGPNNALDPPDVEAGDKFFRGEEVTVHFNEIENAQNYSFWIHKPDSEECVYSDSREGAGDIIFSTDALWGSGTYVLELDVNAPGFIEGHGTLHFAVLDPNDVDLSQDGYYFSVSTENVETFTDVHIIAYVPGAWEGIRLYDIGDEDPAGINWEEYDCTERPGPGVDTWGNWRYPGDHKFYVTHCSGEGWSDPMYMGTVHVNDDATLFLPDSLNTIEREAFAGINARVVVVPDGCTSIGSRAFANCPNLVAIIVPSEGISIAADAFDGCRWNVDVVR